jgi:hypothetical protein
MTGALSDRRSLTICVPPCRYAGNQYQDRRPQGDDEAVREGAAAGSADPGTVTSLYLCIEVAG